MTAADNVALLLQRADSASTTSYCRICLLLYLFATILTSPVHFRQGPQESTATNENSLGQKQAPQALFDWGM